MAVTFPPNPNVGDTVTDPDTGASWIWNGTAWVAQGVGAGGFLPLTGGVLTGALSVNPSAGAGQPAQLTVGGQGITYAAYGSVGQNIAWAFSANQPYMYVNGVAWGPLLTLNVGNTSYLQLSGGTVTGNITCAGLTTTTNQVNAGGWGVLCTGVPNYQAGTAAIGLLATSGFVQITLGGQYLSSSQQSCLPFSTFVGGTQFMCSVFFLNAAATILEFGCVNNAGTGPTVQVAVTSSDRRLKRDIRATSHDALKKVRSVPVYEADLLAPPNKAMGKVPPRHLDFALLADEVERVIPAAYMAPANSNSYAALHPLHLITVLWRAVQQLADELEASRMEKKQT